MIEILEKLLQNVKDGEIIINNTYEKNSLGYELAHILRTSAKTVYCCDSRYKMTNESEGYRIIENGRVVLICGDLLSDRDKIHNIINTITNVTSDISYEINISEKIR